MDPATKLVITPFTPDDDSRADDSPVKLAFRILRQSTLADAPDLPSAGTFRTYRAGVLHPIPGRRVERVLAHLDGRPVGLLQLEFPELDNLGNINVEIHVLPDHRRRGVGRALHAYAVDRAHATGRVRLIGAAAASTAVPTPGAAFAAEMGAKAALAESRSRLDVDAIDPDEFDGAEREARTHSAGYRTVSWTGMTPEDLLDGAAYLYGRMNSDAPTGDLAWEAEKADADIIRQIDAQTLERGRQPYHTGAVHEASGRLVAWTTLVTQPDIAWHAWQSLTIVDPDHRGHRLGLLVKINNLRYATSHQPELRTINTFNAAENAHMIRINEAMGFRPVDEWTQWQQTLQRPQI